MGGKNVMTPSECISLLSFRRLRDFSTGSLDRPLQNRPLEETLQLSGAICPAESPFSVIPKMKWR
jgi:hypothetical protein